jgi:hypothetical protein
LWQFGQRRIAIRHERIVRILAREDRRERETFRHVHRHVLQRMDRKVGALFLERLLELLDEQSLAADRRQAPVENPVALRRHAEQLDRGRLDIIRATLRQRDSPDTTRVGFRAWR